MRRPAHSLEPFFDLTLPVVVSSPLLLSSIRGNFVRSSSGTSPSASKFSQCSGSVSRMTFMSLKACVRLRTPMSSRSISFLIFFRSARLRKPRS